MSSGRRWGGSVTRPDWETAGRDDPQAVYQSADRAPGHSVAEARTATADQPRNDTSVVKTSLCHRYKQKTCSFKCGSSAKEPLQTRAIGTVQAPPRVDFGPAHHRWEGEMSTGMGWAAK